MASDKSSNPLAVKSSDRKRMGTLWVAMIEIFGYRWTNAFGVDAAQGAGATWAKGLHDLSDRQIGEGLAAMVATADDWPPSLPAFRKLCLGIPSLGAVQFELATPSRRETASPFSCLVWSLIDHYRFANASVMIADRLLRDAYHLAVERVMRGEEGGQ